jgi:hypothetical protein
MLQVMMTSSSTFLVSLQVSNRGIKLNGGGTIFKVLLSCQNSIQPSGIVCPATGFPLTLTNVIRSFDMGTPDNVVIENGDGTYTVRYRIPQVSNQTCQETHMHCSAM